MSIIEEEQMLAEKSVPILYIEDGSNSDGTGESEIGYLHLYPNRWAFSIKIKDSGDL